jgi:transposase
MERWIGQDQHAVSTTFAVIGESGKRLGSHVVETNEQALVEQLETIPGKRHVCFEEGTQSAWLYEIFSPHAEEVVVTMVPESRGQKNDESDAFQLASPMRAGAIKRRMLEEVGEYRELRELGRAHRMIVQDVVRVQNRIKALFRPRGVAVSGKSVYLEKGREELLAQLPDASRGAAKTMCAQYDAIEAIRREAEKDLVKEAHRHPISKVRQECPGLGPIRVAQLLPIVASPARFRTKQQFWSYCGLGIVMRSSSDWVQKPDKSWARAEVKQTRGLNYNHNHTLEHIFNGATTTVSTRRKTEPLHQDYQRLITAGTKPNLGIVDPCSQARLAIALSMWKSKETYDPTRHRKQGS